MQNPENTVEWHLLQRKEQAGIKRSSGRPLKNPFHHTQVEEDLCQRARAMVQRYYDSSPQNTKKPFVLTGGVRMGKTTFWAAIYYYYTTRYVQSAEAYYCPLYPDLERPLMDTNLDYFLRTLCQWVGREPVGDRVATLRAYQMLAEKSIASMTEIREKSPAEASFMNKYRCIYQTVLRCWNTCLQQE